MVYSVKIRKEALIDIQEIVAWYEAQKPGLGGNFKIIASKRIDLLETFPHIHCIRYDNIRCISLGKFPYMVHYTIDEESNKVEILAVISTHRDPEIWRIKTRKK